MTEEMRLPLPPFSLETAAQKVRMAEDAWSTRDPERVAGAYPIDSQWRNRTEFPVGREMIKAILRRKWSRELDYRLIKELCAVGGDRIAVRFSDEWHDADGNWFRSYGNESWAFDSRGLMARRLASINDLPIATSDTRFHWPLGVRPGSDPGLSKLGLQLSSVRDAAGGSARSQLLGRRRQIFAGAPLLPVRR